MSKILITGATGNIGFEVIRFLSKLECRNKLIAGVRNIEKAKHNFTAYPQLNYVHFDFEDFATFDNALLGIDKIFLMRPPHISDIERYFKPLLGKIKDKNIRQIVFLSVQGAEKSRVIPHNKIERLIKQSGVDFIFLRPSYFMQNLTTTLIADIRSKRKIILPAGRAKFNWIDVENIGEAAAMLLTRFAAYQNQAIEITGLENEKFETVARLIDDLIDKPLKYQKVNPLKFYRMKQREGMAKGKIMVMILLHFLPRFQKEPKISDFYERLTGKKPTTLKEFIVREKKQFE
jgi:uncharacterized protein YbjT (DUF2867 family)